LLWPLTAKFQEQNEGKVKNEVNEEKSGSKEE